MMQYPRSQWPKALMALPSDQVIKRVDELSTNLKIVNKTLPQSGLGLLKMQDSAFHEPYYLGEIPLSSAWVTVETEQGAKVQGAAQIMDNNIELAQSIAISDAILSAQLEGHDTLESLVHQGMALCKKQDKIRNAMLLKTAVDFSLLSDAEEE